MKIPVYSRLLRLAAACLALTTAGCAPKPEAVPNNGAAPVDSKQPPPSAAAMYQRSQQAKP